MSIKKLSRLPPKVKIIPKVNLYKICCLLQTTGYLAEIGHKNQQFDPWPPLTTVSKNVIFTIPLPPPFH